MTRNTAIVDSGPLIALFDGSDRHHHEAIELLAGVDRVLVTTLAVVTECVYMLRFSNQAQIEYLEWVRSPALAVASLEDEDYDRIIEVMEKYADLPADFADATLVALADRLGVSEIISFDRDFDIYRTSDGRGFRRLPR